MQLHSGCRPTIGCGRVVRNAESASSTSSLCRCIVGADQPLVAAELSAMRSPQAPPPSRRSQDLTTARHFRRSLRANFGRMSTSTRGHHPPLCSCIVGTDQPLVAAKLSAMQSPEAVLFCTNRQNAPVLHFTTWGNAGVLSIRTKPAGPEGSAGPIAPKTPEAPQTGGVHRQTES